MRRAAEWLMAGLSLAAAWAPWTPNAAARVAAALLLAAIAVSLVDRGRRLAVAAILYGLLGMWLFGVVFADRASSFSRTLGLAVHAAALLFGIARARGRAIVSS